MTRVRSSQGRDQFSTLVNRVAYGKERIVVSRRGKDVAALVPIEDLRLLERLSRDRDLTDIDDAALTEAEQTSILSPVRDL